MVFTWFLSPLNNTYINISANIVAYFIEMFFPRLTKIILTPFVYPGLLWIVLPLVAATILMILYFGRYRNEQLGWSTAFSNNIVLIFVSINLLQHLSGQQLLLSDKALFVYLVLLYNLTQLIINYLHLIPKGVSFIINSTIPINVIHYVAIIITYSDIVFDATTFLAIFILILLIYGLARILWFFVPMSKSAKTFTTIKERKAKESEQIEQVILKHTEDIKKERDDKSLQYLLIGYIILYLLLFLINKFLLNLEDYYLIILSLYFIISSLAYMRFKKLSWTNLYTKGSVLRRNLSVLVGVLIFAYYIIASNFFINTFSVNSYNTNRFLLIITIIITSLSCEFFFRGIIQRGLKAVHNENYSVAVQAFFWSLLKHDLFIAGSNNLINALIGVILIYPIGLLLGFMKESWRFDSALTASLTNSALAIIFLLL
ncbi:MAG: hypothetical protein JW791_04580 [Nanoarchaeota archaeon]|nr:hypothetical protein [Nanoarchaeota archaeon]